MHVVGFIFAAICLAKISVVVLVNFKIELFASLTAFVHAMLYKVLQILGCICSKYLLKISIMISIVIILINSTIIYAFIDS